ncbi:hypothetical protein RHMOL_Rhmol13G0239200 [Rhododendron molle]|uniref:Uncharacterized protein n=1 Tax=Rhododendron molle TaxID=49168 RepID=A0ACC0LBJ8_RHOML|nr:hypothetical protein RHMOL_Rhmol13G0239200 [Rhododendron molle]
MVVEFFLLSCTGIVVFLHGANFFFHAISSHLAFRSLRYTHTHTYTLSLSLSNFF